MFVIMETRVCTREYIKKGGWDMRHNLKAAAVSALAIMAALAMSIPAYAADKKISEVKFRVNAKPEAGDSIGDPDRKSTRLNSSHIL